MPESPKFLFSQERYDEAREALDRVAQFNGNKYSSSKYSNFKFVAEQIRPDDDNDENQSLVIPVNEQLVEAPPVTEMLTDSEFKANVVKMTVMWCNASFCTYLMLFLNKYLEGTIFLNYYLEGLAGIIGAMVAGTLYSRILLKGSFIVSLSMTLLGSVCIFLFEGKHLNPSIVYSIGISSKSSFPDGSEEQRTFYLGKLIPILGFFIKIGLNITF